MQAEWCARWTSGRTICGHATNKPTGLYYLAADRDWSTYQAAFDAAGLPDIPHYTLADDMLLDPQTWKSHTAYELFKFCLDKLSPLPGGLVFVDPLAPLFIVGEQNRARDVAISLHLIRRNVRHRQVTLVGSANVGKPKIDEEYLRPQDRISGSGAFVAYSDTQIYMQSPEKPGEPTTLGWTPRLRVAEEFQFQFDLTTKLFVPFTGLASSGQTAATDRPTQILLLIPDDGIDTGDLFALVFAKFGVTRMTLHRDLKKLEDRGLISLDEWGRISRRKLS